MIIRIGFSRKVATLVLPLLFAVGCGSGSGSTVATPGSGGVPSSPGSGSGSGGAGGRGPSPVALGSAANFIILGQSAVTDVPSSAITGNVGLSPATGAGIGVSCPEVTGNIYSVDAAGPACKITAASTLTTAVNDTTTAYNDAAGRAADYVELGAGNIGGLNLGPATYKWSTALLIPTNLTLTGGPNDVWIFEVAQGLTVSSGVQIILAGGALAKNIYWQVFSAADLGTTSSFKGTIISHTSIVMKTGATINGRLLAGTAITLDHSVVAP
jgi:hypothetical protein